MLRGIGDESKGCFSKINTKTTKLKYQFNKNKISECGKKLNFRILWCKLNTLKLEQKWEIFIMIVLAFITGHTLTGYNDMKASSKIYI